MKSPIKVIRLTRIEGAANGPVAATASSWDEANAILMKWAHTAPTSGYDKTSFEIEWENGFSYGGRYDIQHPSVAVPDLMRNVQNNALFYTGRYCPGNMPMDRYTNFLRSLDNKSRKEQYELMLQENDLGFNEELPPKL